MPKPIDPRAWFISGALLLVASNAAAQAPADAPPATGAKPAAARQTSQRGSSWKRTSGSPTTPQSGFRRCGG